MMTFTIKLTEKDIKGILDDLEYWYSVKMTRSQLSKFLQKHPRLAAEIVQMGFDTGARESFIEYLSTDLTGTMWPLNGDALKYKKEFYKLFTTAAKKAGIQYDPDDAF